MLVFDRVFDMASGGHGNRAVAATALAALLLNLFYYVAARTRRAVRLQAYLRMFVDITLITVGMAAVGGVAAGQYLSIYAIIPVYAGLVLSSEVVAGVAHEMNNLLAVALGQTELLLREARGLPPAVVAGVERIRHSCETASRIVQNALSTARQSADERVLLALSQIVDRITELKRYDLRRDRIVIRSHFAADMRPVVGVPFQLQQVVLNLMTNAQQALQHHPHPRDIEVVGLQDGARVVVEVRDNGPGIAPTDLPRLFEPFYTTKAAGTGLGLAISATIAREHGGELTAENRPGGGAIFRLVLPAAELADRSVRG